MIKIFIATFFISEIIIAFAIIMQIVKLNRIVNRLSLEIVKSKGNIQIFLSDLRLLFREFVENFNKTKLLLRQKRNEYALKTAKTTLTYLAILLLKGKYKKAIITWQFATEVFSGIREATDL